METQFLTTIQLVFITQPIEFCASSSSALPFKVPKPGLAALEI